MAKPTRQDFWVEGPSGKLRATRCGEGGTPVLFVHGMTGHREQWEAQLAHVCSSRLAMAFDLRGMGESARAFDGDSSLEAMVKDITAVADRLGLARFIIVGHSYGGSVVAAFAARHPDRLAGIVYADANGNLSELPPGEISGFLENFSAEKFSGFREHWFDPLLQDARPEVREDVLTSQRATPRELIAPALEDLVRFNPLPAVRAFPRPQFAIAAERFTGPESLVAQVPELPRHIMKGVSHWLMMDRPEEFNRHLDTFLAQVDSVSERPINELPAPGR